MTIESELLSQANELLADLARLNSNVELYTQVNSLQQNLVSLEENVTSFQNNLKTATCNKQCKDLNTKKDPNSVEDLLVQLLLYNQKPSAPEPSAPPLELEPSAPPLELEPSAPPL
jgi:NAD-dependent SIR2 family protein deacetylase